MVLDWSVRDLNNQIAYADLVLTGLGIKSLVIEVKRPGALAWNRRAVEAALTQAHTYADRQSVRCVGVTDGFMLYLPVWGSQRRSDRSTIPNRVLIDTFPCFTVPRTPEYASTTPVPSGNIPNTGTVFSPSP